MKYTTRKKQIRCAEKILIYLNQNFDSIKGYPDQTSWGYAFTFLIGCMSSFNVSSLLVQKSLNLFLKQNTSNYNYPWEFIVFAIKEASYLYDKKFSHPSTSLRGKGTAVLNWKLIHFYNKIQFKKFSFFDEIVLKILIKTHQTSYGLLMDEYFTRSLQYHNFSLLILLKIYEKKKNYKWLKNKIILAIEFSIDNIFSDGTSQFLGRGQEQIFGYGSLIASLKLYEKLFQKDLDNFLNLLLDKLLRHQKENGFIPLILRNQNNTEEKESFSNKKKPPGWYSYNSSFDYLPFLCYCLLIDI